MSIPSATSPVNPGSVYTELLAPTRSSRRRGFTWEPAGPASASLGTLVITTDRSRARYELEEVYASPGFGAGRAFRLVKPDGDRYSCFLADDRHLSTCDCAGFCYEATPKADRRHGDRTDSLSCKHLDTLASLIWNGWLPESRTNADVDVGDTETTDQPLPACFRDLPALPVPGCPF